MLLSSFPIIITKQLTSSVTRPFDSSPAVYYKWSTVTEHASVLHHYGDMVHQR